MREVLYATNNPSKVEEVSRILGLHRIKVWTPQSLGILYKVEESGSSLEQNARLKFNAGISSGVGMTVLADDTEVEIEPLNGEPGMFVRRWRDHRTEMSDEEIIQYCLDRLNGVPFEKRVAKFRTVICVGTNDQDAQFFDGYINGLILEEPIPLRMKGFPFESLFYIPQINKVLGRVHQLKVNQRSGFLTHRERAIEAALPLINQLLKQEISSN